jgi:hypothetical protein
MAVKWKIYYGCCVYLLLWNISLFCLIGYMFISDFHKVEISDILLLTPLLMMGKPFTAFRLLEHLKNDTLVKNRELILFVAFFLMNIIYTVIIAISQIEVLIINSNSFDNENIIMSISCCLFILASIYLLIFDMQLKNKMQKQYDDRINQIGQALTHDDTSHSSK